MREDGAVSGWWRQDTPIGPITVVASADGIAAIAWSSDDELDFTARAVDAPARRDRGVATALDEWFVGDRKELDVDVDPSFLPSAPFARRVLDTLRSDVGWGEVVSYGELAEMAGGPGAARAVGTAMAHNPVPFVIPCHRADRGARQARRVWRHEAGCHAQSPHQALVARARRRAAVRQLRPRRRLQVASHRAGGFASRRSSPCSSPTWGSRSPSCSRSP